MVDRKRLAVVLVSCCLCACSGGGGPSAELPFRNAKIQVSQGQVPGPWFSFPIPTALSNPLGLALGPDKNVWFVENGGDKLGRITPAGAISEFVLPSAISPVGIAKGKGNLLWFTGVQPNGQGVTGSINSTTGVIKTYATPTASSGPNSIILGPDGNMWFTEEQSSAIAVVKTTGAVLEYPTLTPNAAPLGITVGSDGALWFSESTAGRIGRITTAGAMTEYSGASQPTYLVKGKDNNVWFTDPSNHALGVITPGGIISEISLGSSAQPVGITTNGGNNWFIDDAIPELEYVIPTNHDLSAPLPIPGSATSPQQLVFGADNNLWITEAGSNSIEVYDQHPQTATPSSISFTGLGQTQSFTVSELSYSGQFTVAGCPMSIATVAPSGPAKSFTVTAVGVGNCSLTISDNQFNTSQMSITVTSTTFIVQ